MDSTSPSGSQPWCPAAGCHWPEERHRPTWASNRLSFNPTGSLLDLLPPCNPRAAWAPFSNGYIKLRLNVQQWSVLLQRKPGHRLIALHWQETQPRTPLYSRVDLFPSSVAALRQLADVVSLYRKGWKRQFQNNSGLNFVAGQGKVSQSMDFQDTAAVLANCDLLISADSAVVHLAGAMGIPLGLPCGGFRNGDGA